MKKILIYSFLIYSVLPNIHFRYISKKVMKNVSADDKRIAFTFDDGPDPRYTPQLLDVLKKNDVKATFFVLGEKAKNNPELIRRIVEEGHTIGLHANRHICAPFHSYKTIKNDMNTSHSLLKNMGIKVGLYRPPWGLVHIASQGLIRKYKFKSVLWSIHASDWSRYVDENHIVKTLTEKVKPGDIILLHDGRGAENAPQRTINALRTALPVMKRQGYHFVKLVEEHTVASLKGGKT